MLRVKLSGLYAHVRLVLSLKVWSLWQGQSWLPRPCPLPVLLFNFPPVELELPHLSLLVRLVPLVAILGLLLFAGLSPQRLPLSPLLLLYFLHLLPAEQVFCTQSRAVLSSPPFRRGDTFLSSLE